MAISIHTNASAMTALQNLNNTNKNLESVQDRISTGLQVKSAKDNASVYAIAQGQRADLNSLSAVRDSLNRASSIADVSLAAGETVSDLLNELREKVVAGMEQSIDTASRNAINADFQSILRQIAQIVDNATFNGANLLNGAQTADIQFIADADATSNITLSMRDMSLGGGIITLTLGNNLLSASNATSALGLLDSTIRDVNANLGALGSQAKQIEGHMTFIAKLSDSIQAGVGNLVDADLAKESLMLQALQVQQQLGTQALSIANQAPQSILSLFRG